MSKYEEERYDAMAAEVKPQSEEEKHFLRWLAGWDDQTSAAMIAIVKRLKEGRDNGK